MPIVSTFCKKGGVGKTTLLGYLAHYHAQQGKTVLVISVDDQNSIFKLFGKDGFIDERTDNYFEHLLAGQTPREEIVCEARDGLYLIKTLNTDTLSLNLTLQRPQEKKLRALIADFEQYFDYIFVDFPPSSSRLTEILLDISQNIILVVGLDTLGLDGFKNTIQYFVDSDIELSKISHIIPNNYNPIKKTPKSCLESLKKQAKEYTPGAKITEPMNELAIIKNLQAEGVSIFDEHDMGNRFHNKNRARAIKELSDLYKSIKL